ncbi:MAG: hypothetical protein JW966_09880 [Anaerolineae bacterium]|nr:hypothetical protein [Anaerolineae bacterium]
MKRVFTALMLVMLVTVMLAACGGGDDDKEKTSPVDTAKAIMSAFEAQDADQMITLSCSDTGQDPFGGLNFQFTFSNLGYDTQNEQDNSADVHISGHVTAQAGDLTQESDFAWVLKMQKRDGEWCVLDIQM